MPAGSKFIDDYVFGNKEIKVIYLTDANIYSMRNYYWSINDKNFEILNNLEISAVRRANAIIVSSEWARNSFIEHYNCNPDKIIVAKFPAYLPDLYSPKKYEKNKLKLLFVGVERERKGADIAIEAFSILREKLKNFEVSFDVVGLDNDKFIDIPNLKFRGRLDKLKDSDLKTLIGLYKQASLFILPTRAECAGIVFSEACLYGLPIFTTDTGGIGSYVIDSYNGYKLSLKGSGNDFAEAILNSISNLPSLSNNARMYYENNLSEQIRQEKFGFVIKDILPKNN